MSCTEIRNLFSDTIDGRASVTEIAAVDRHVTGCAACRTELEDLRRVLAAVKSLPARKAPAGFAQGVMSRIATANRMEAVPHAPRATLRLSTAVKFAASAAAAVLVCVGIVRLGDGRGSPKETVTKVTQPEPGVTPPAEDEYRAREESETLAKTPQGASADLKAGEGKELQKMQEKAKELESRKAATRGPGRPSAGPAGGDLSLQKITVYSADVAADSEQVAEVLRASGYTFSSAGEDGRMLVKVPKAEAAQILAALEKSRNRVERGVEEKLERAEQQAQEKELAGAAPPKADGLVAKAEQLEGALRQLRELRGENDRRRAGGVADAERKKSKQGGEEAAGADAGWGQDPARTAGGMGNAPGKDGAAFGDDSKGGSKKTDKNADRGVAGGKAANPKPAGAQPPADAAPGEQPREHGAREPQAPATGEGGGHNESGDREDDLKEDAESEGAVALEEPVLDELEKGNFKLEHEVFLVIEFRAGPPPAADPAPVK